MAQRRFIRIGNLRLLTAVAALALAWLSFGKHSANPWTLIVPLLVFVSLAVYHQRILRRRQFAERAIRFYQQAINRIQDNWRGNGAEGEKFRDPLHPYADDLDVFGKGSLFELVSSARTVAGEQTLASWLQAPANEDEAKARQSAVKELAPKLDLREEMALLGEDIQSEIDAETLAQWGLAPAILFPAPLRAGALVLALTGLMCLALRVAEIWPLWPLVMVLACNGAILFWHRGKKAAVEAGIETAAHRLGLLSLLVERLEQERFACVKLTSVRESLATEGIAASRRIRQLDRWLELLDSSDHIILRVLEPVTLYKLQIVMAIERWRSKNGGSIGRWIEALAEFEALTSLAALHYERPEWCFPTLDSAAKTHFLACDLGHPLLSEAVSVRNSLELNDGCRLLIVSGSNMSGKSTLLRAVGLNTVLAWAGAPVCATSLQLSCLQVAASLRVSDSLQDNRSRFFAEITRLRQIVGLTHGKNPVLFLLDELLSGTNSHDRRIGATGIVRSLLEANTIGLLTTHDLALAQLDEEAGFAAQNVHLEDRIINGKMEFDYHLRPGVVTHSNALELMRSIGLEI